MDGLSASLEKMRTAGVPQTAIDTFGNYYERLRGGDTGVLREDEIDPVERIPDFDELPDAGQDSAVLERAVVIKLNGGLGTSMGLTSAKSLLEIKDGLTFLDVIVRQVLAIRKVAGPRLPLVLMNSFATHDDTLAAIERYPELAGDVPLAFVQNRFPKLLADQLTPVSWPANPSHEWAPPGHGDLYAAIVASGMLDSLLERGYRYAFVSNSDNLGATLEPRILSWFAELGAPFVMEVADRTAADRKGGHLARRRDGQLVLRESAQTREEDTEAFQDVTRHRYFNTNNLWLDLRALDELLARRGGVLGLPMIVNRKTVDPADRSTPAVIQLEAAMGAAISVFEGSAALRVPKRRFAPVKTTDDLLVVRSDAYALAEDATVELAPGRREAPVVELDPEFFKLLADFESRFRAGPPSLVDCERLRVRGDVTFGRGVMIRGDVAIDAAGGARRIEDGAVLCG